jgi:hypothetical protein
VNDEPVNEEPVGDEKEPRFAGWVHRHTELVWAALGVVFVIYGISALVNVTQGVLGIDYANVISTFGGFIAAIVAGILALRTRREKRNSPDADE